MQTFVPYSNYEAIARVLDNKRLHKQALEAWQILMVLTELDPDGNYRQPKGWVNHPAVKMWRGHEFALYMYIEAMVTEWIRRGYKSSIGVKAIATIGKAYTNGKITSTSPLPPWLTISSVSDAVMSSHRKALLAKNYAWYHQFEWPEDDGMAPSPTDYEYVWPVE